jgi:hypothetical protein
MNHREQTDRADGPLISPRPVLLAGLGLVALGWIWGLALDDTAPALRALTLALGLTAIGTTLVLYLPWAKPDLEGRMIAVGLWVLGGIAAYVAQIGLGTHFDSLGVLLVVLTLAAITGAILTAVPAGWRLVGVSVLILLHFAAIFTAVTVVPPPNGPPPFVANQLWTRLSRPYLQLTVLNNGYHFYAPEPGPSALMWFYVEFSDGASTWVRFPDHKTVATHIERRRLGALATMVGQPVPVQPARLDELTDRRIRAGLAHNPPIPMGEMPPAAQYREPNVHAALLIASYARRVARTTEHPDGADSPVRGVKVYRVEYMNPPVQHFQAGREPLDPTLYMAIYMGEFDREGTLKPECLTIERTKEGRITNRIQDPFLYWQLPIVSIPLDEDAVPDVGPRRREGEPGMWQSEGKIINYVRIHAGDKKDQESIP